MNQDNKTRDDAGADTLRLALPKGRMQEAVLALLADAGIRVTPTARGYRPAVSLSDCEAKILKHQNIVEMLELGSRDVGFAGADWVEELDADVVELLDTGLDPVSVVAAAPTGLFDRLDERRTAARGRIRVRDAHQGVDRTARPRRGIRAFLWRD